MLNLAVPGLGHVYSGHPLRALLTFALINVLAVLVLLLTFAILGTGPRLAVLLLFVAGFWIVLAADGARVARRTPAGRRRDFQRWPVLVGMTLFIALAIQPLGIVPLREQFVLAFRMPSGAMEPTLLPGDWLFAHMGVAAPPRRDDIVVLRDDEVGHAIYRVVGVPGDTLSMQDFRLSRNRQPVDEPWAQLRDSALAFRAQSGDSVRSDGPPVDVRTWGPLIVPADSYFVLGDTRDASADSRYRGFISREEIVGRPQWVYMSIDRDGDVRWQRIGLRIH